MTPDPAISSAKPNDPGSWNRYSYTGGDPVNRTDSSGLDWVYDFGTGTWHSSLDYNDLCWMNVGACQQMFSGSVFAYDLGSANWMNFLQFSDPYDLRYGAPGFGPDVNRDNIWGNVLQACNGQALDYLSRAGIDPYKPGGPSYAANGGILWTLTDAEAAALSQQLSDGNWTISNVTGAMHTGDVGSPNTDYRAYRGVYGDRSIQIVIGPAIVNQNGTTTHNVYADTDAFNPNESLGSWLGHAFTEVLPGVMGFNVGCGL